MTGANGWEEDGKTTIWFRKKMGGCTSDNMKKADHPFEGSLHLIWAHGQDSSDNDFYADDELKFHSKENSGIDVFCKW